MSISSSLNAGVAGLNANATRLATISDNIANANTAGYKRMTTSFESMVLGGSGGGYSAGGVSTVNTRMIDERGSLVGTTNATDLAVSGGGFLPVANITEVEAGEDPTMALTTTGSFRLNQDGYLTSSSGLVLLGFPAASDQSFPSVPRDSTSALEPVRINTSAPSAEPTTTIEMGVNLPADETAAGASGDDITQTVEYYDNLGRTQKLTLTYTPTVPGTGNSNEWTLVITDSATNAGGTTIGDYTMTFNDSATADGLNSVATTTGTAYDATAGTIAVNTGSGMVEIFIGTPGDDNGLTQLASPFSAQTIEKDGYPAASQTGVEVDENGFVHALFDNGSSRVVYQIPLAHMANPNGMQAMDNQTYKPTTESGSFYLWDANAGPTGAIQGYSREESKTDVAGELTAMIQTQRAYSSNATVIQTVDEMLQEATNLKR